jgi:hypothetical protein
MLKRGSFRSGTSEAGKSLHYGTWISALEKYFPAPIGRTASKKPLEQNKNGSRFGCLVCY